LTQTTAERIGGYMARKKFVVHAECPACACGDISFLGPEKLKEKFIGDEKEIDILCPMCGTKTKGKGRMEEEKK
jgi:Zn ribbon nucleic-acid-binding protein